MQYMNAWDEEGCFVYQVLDKGAIEARKEPSSDGSCRTGMAFQPGELVSIDLVLQPGDSNNGSFLRLSDHKG